MRRTEPSLLHLFNKVGLPTIHRWVLSCYRFAVGNQTPDCQEPLQLFPALVQGCPFQSEKMMTLRFGLFGGDHLPLYRRSKGSFFSLRGRSVGSLFPRIFTYHKSLIILNSSTYLRSGLVNCYLSLVSITFTCSFLLPTCIS